MPSGACAAFVGPMRNQRNCGSRRSLEPAFVLDVTCPCPLDPCMQPCDSNGTSLRPSLHPVLAAAPGREQGWLSWLSTGERARVAQAAARGLIEVGIKSALSPCRPVICDVRASIRCRAASTVTHEHGAALQKRPLEPQS